jgi:hypothetical protein
LIERPQSDLAVSTQAELLSLNRSGLYYQPVALSAEEVALKHRIDELYTLCLFMDRGASPRSYNRKESKSIAKRCNDICEKWVSKALVLVRI